MNTENQENRRKAIQKALKRGDQTRIARLADVRREWVYLVVHGQGTSERILSIAEQMIAERNRQN